MVSKVMNTTTTLVQFDPKVESQFNFFCSYTIFVKTNQLYPPIKVCIDTM